MNRKLIFVSAGLVSAMGLVGYCYLRRKKEMIVYGHGTNTEPSKEDKELIKMIGAGSSPDKCPGMTPREKKELQDRIKAMSLQEQEAILEVIPVSLCMHRIQLELDHAREFESMIKKAYDMKQ